MSKRENRAKSLAASNAPDTPWDAMAPTERDVFRRQAEREGFSTDHDPTDPDDAVDPGMAGRLGDLTALFQVIDGDADQADEHTVEGLDIGAVYDDHELQTEPDEDSAYEALNALALSLEATTTLEIVFGTGGPDDRLIFECSGGGIELGSEDTAADVEIRRVLYRFSWAGKSAERVLYGEDREVAERFGRHVLPELAS